MTPRRKVSTRRRLDATAALSSMRPRTSLSSCAGLVDGAAVLIEAGQPPEVVSAIFACLRLRPEQVDQLVVTLVAEDPPSPGLRVVDQRHPAAGDADA